MTFSVLSANAKLGIAPESATAQYAAPAFTIPFSAGTRYRSVITQLTDRTVRARDTDIQDIQQGPSSSDFTITSQAYADWAGWLYRAMVGTDQFTPGTPAMHLFQQDRDYSTVWPSYSLTTDDGIDVLGWPGCFLGAVRLKVTASGYATLTSTWNGWPPATVPTFTEAQSDAQPLAGWQWGITTAGGTSTRGMTLDLALTRELDVVKACGQQAPYCIGAGPMRASGSYTAIFDTPADLNLYRDAIQEPAMWTLTQPASQGGDAIEVTLSLSGWTAGDVSLEDEYVTAAFSLSGIANPVDSTAYGVASVRVLNDVQAPYGP